MTDLSAKPEVEPFNWSSLISRPSFQRWAMKFPLTRPFVRREGSEIFKLIQGFVESQVLYALVDLGILERLAAGPQSIRSLAQLNSLSEDRMQALLQAGAALRLLRRRRDNRFTLASRGHALLSVPGLQDMIRHHRVLYEDLKDPVAMLRSPQGGALAEFWPYVFGSTISKQDAQRYSHLMSDSQHLVADDTLSLVSFAKATHVMDIGGGTGTFLCALGKAYRSPRLTLFDLPQTAPDAKRYIAERGLTDRIVVNPGSFRSDPLPCGADLITLVRVCYDHDDETVLALLRAIHSALPVGGTLVISEPMSGGMVPDPITDVYFSMYTRAMGTGRTRSADDFSNLLKKSGFSRPTGPKTRRSYITSTLETVKLI
ncbi:MAG: methyltransferase [Pseudoprimorskyibacter sp.]|nr:methyltransferase [Pseudoprimorskyibacter sp.]